MANTKIILLVMGIVFILTLTALLRLPQKETLSINKEITLAEQELSMCISDPLGRYVSPDSLSVVLAKQGINIEGELNG